MPTKINHPDRKIALNVESWRREKIQQQQRSETTSERSLSPEKRHSPSRTPRRTSGFQSPSVFSSQPQEQPLTQKAILTKISTTLVSSKDSASPARQTPSVITTVPLELSGTRGVKEYSEESDIFEEISVMLKNWWHSRNTEFQRSEKLSKT